MATRRLFFLHSSTKSLILSQIRCFTTTFWRLLIAPSGIEILDVPRLEARQQAF